MTTGPRGYSPPTAERVHASCGYTGRMALKRIDISHSGDEWVAKSGGEVIDRSAKKADLVKATATAARSTGEATSVRIHGKNGRIQEERTYPRSADPKGSKG